MSLSPALASPSDPLSLVSVHDVMPETLTVIERTLETLSSLNVGPVTLLVVPGRDWSAADLTRLHALAQQGHELAAHGWRHQAERIGGLYHRLHALFLSRTVAEHLALDADGIMALLKRSQDWFIQQGFPPPALYVPPAWAMGAITRARLSAEGPFARYEVFGGIYEAATQEWRPTPMLGYEADTPARVLPLKLWNALNRRRARAAEVIRIGIHPHDLDYALAGDLKADLKRFDRCGDYAQRSPGG
ncbi:polysaccharide deacetylase family protein [Thiorhodovibrio frisius]|uniref:Putative deacetylase n=1 Tax=Thiorhodovibrio frisius TaxID=631362 RepID=H8YXD5_9GAMM|nr:polysaccharide deacetylase family protein [Thiorhodovibrio frisius]EIC23111.1 putative deacetylase [Thiorhodovibrio frisius]WPL22625.1 hypothetical protein Thiofri_02792 [Thiorhodovibrio frisius]